MSETAKSFAIDEAPAVGEEIGIDWANSPFDVQQFRIGMNVEARARSARSRHQRQRRRPPRHREDRALAHLNEFPDYYVRLEQMEEEARRDWAERTGTPRTP